MKTSLFSVNCSIYWVPDINFDQFAVGSSNTGNSYCLSPIIDYWLAGSHNFYSEYLKSPVEAQKILPKVPAYVVGHL